MIGQISDFDIDMNQNYLHFQVVAVRSLFNRTFVVND